MKSDMSISAAGISDFEMHRAYTVDQAADLLAVSRGTIYKMLASGKLKSFELGSRKQIQAPK